MGVIAFNPMLHAGYDVQARLRRHHRRRHARHPDPAVGDDHRLRGGGRAVGGEALRRGDVPGLLPGLPLPRLHHRLGDDQSEDRAAAAGGADARAGAGLDARASRPPIRATCWSRSCTALFVAGQGARRSRPTASRSATGMLLKNFVHRAGAARADRGHALGCCGGTWSSISRPASRRVVRTGSQQLGRARSAPTAAAAGRAGPSDRVLHLVLRPSPPCCAAAARPLLLAHERRAVRDAEAPDLLGDAARHPHRRRARR